MKRGEGEREGRRRGADLTSNRFGHFVVEQFASAPPQKERKKELSFAAIKKDPALKGGIPDLSYACLCNPNTLQRRSSSLSLWWAGRAYRPVRTCTGMSGS